MKHGKCFRFRFATDVRWMHRHKYIRVYHCNGKGLEKRTRKNTVTRISCHMQWLFVAIALHRPFYWIAAAVAAAAVVLPLPHSQYTTLETIIILPFVCQRVDTNQTEIKLLDPLWFICSLIYIQQFHYSHILYVSNKKMCVFKYSLS